MLTTILVHLIARVNSGQGARKIRENKEVRMLNVVHGLLQSYQVILRTTRWPDQSGYPQNENTPNSTMMSTNYLYIPQTQLLVVYLGCYKVAPRFWSVLRCPHTPGWTTCTLRVAQTYATDRLTPTPPPSKLKPTDKKSHLCCTPCSWPVP